MSNSQSTFIDQNRDHCEISAHIPHSFWHKTGAYWAAKKLLHRGVPDCKHAKFLTLTVARRSESGKELYGSPAECFEDLKKEPAYSVQRLRKAGYPIIAYICKLELHEDGYPHWHLVLWCKEKIHFDDLNDSWPYGYAKINKIRKQQGLLYTLKYSFKGAEPPEWVKSYSRIQVCRKSRGFYEALKENGYDIEDFPPKKPRESSEKKRPETMKTIGERLIAWASMVKLKKIVSGRTIHETLKIDYEFAEIYNRLIRVPTRNTFWMKQNKIIFEQYQKYEMFIRSISEKARRTAERKRQCGTAFTWPRGHPFAV